LSFLKNLKINTKLILILLFPVIGLLYFSLSGISEKAKLSGEMSSLQKLSALAVKISALVHETQKERGMTAGFLGSKGKQFATDLTAQRKETDNKIKNLETFLTAFEEENLGMMFKNTVNRALDNLKQLQGKRDAVRTLNIPLKEALAYYTNMNTSFLNVISDMSKISTNAELSTLISAYVNFLQGKERAGIERAVLSNVFAANKFAPRMFNRFSSLVTAQDVYRSVFLAVATSEQKDFFQNKMQNPAVEEVTRMRKIAFEKALEGNFGVDAAYWFKTQTNKINLLKEVEDKLSDDLKRISAQIKSKSQTALYFFIGITMVAFLSSIFLGLLVARSITRPLGKMTDAALKLASGNIEQSIEYKSGDEIGKLADSFRDMKESFTGLFDETNALIGAIQEGKLDTRGNETAFTGSWGELVGNINKLIEAFVGPLKVTAEYIDCISKGDIPEKITDDYKGDFSEIKNNLNGLIDVMNGLHSETAALIESMRAGKLDTRGDADKFTGNWGELIAGINDIVNAYVGPFNVTAEYVERISKGDIPQKITDEYKGDFNEIKNNLNGLIDSLQFVVAMAQKFEAGDYTAEVKLRSKEDKFMVAIRGMVSELNNSLSQIFVAVEQFSAGAEQVSQSSQAVSQGATKQASALEETTASVTEISSQAQQNSENASEASQLAASVRTSAQDGNEQMNQMLKAMEDLNDSSGQISKIIKVIDEIAFQTNLLSLNAAVEAARAGVHGKGFAVVAEEVRNLAQRSAKAAKETTELIEGSVTKTQYGTQMAHATHEALGKIINGIKRVTDFIEEINSASKEQVQGIDEVTEALTQIDMVTQANTASAEESAAASEELAGQSLQLKDVLSKFKLKRLKHNAMPTETNMEPKIVNDNKAVAETASKAWGTADADGNAELKNPVERKSEDVIGLDDDEFGKF